MAKAANANWLPEQQHRLDEFNAARSVDIHCHCLPGLDDGPGSLEDSIALCEALVLDGITTVIATPHQLGRYDRLNSAEDIYEGVTELSAELDKLRIPLEILPGGDVRVDERLPKLLDLGEVRTAADAGCHLLLELPHELYVDPLSIIDLLRERGLQAIMTHPERHHYLSVRHSWAGDWITHGAVLQVTAGSLLGEFGDRAYHNAWHLVQNGLASLVATDAHDTNRRPPRMSEAIKLLTRQVGSDVTRLLTIENPLRVLSGEVIVSPQLS